MSFPIPIEAFREAYEKTGLRPVWKKWYRRAKDGKPRACGCPLTAVLMANGYSPDSDPYHSDVVKQLVECGFQIDSDQVVSFIGGTDGYLRNSWYEREAYDFGVRVREEVMRPIARAMKGETK